MRRHGTAETKHLHRGSLPGSRHSTGQARQPGPDRQVSVPRGQEAVLRGHRRKRTSSTAWAVTPAGSVIDLVMKLDGLDFKEAVQNS